MTMNGSNDILVLDFKELRENLKFQVPMGLRLIEESPVKTSIPQQDENLTYLDFVISDIRACSIA